MWGLVGVIEYLLARAASPDRFGFSQKSFLAGWVDYGAQVLFSHVLLCCAQRLVDEAKVG
jgi:hypothetical protein